MKRGVVRRGDSMAWTNGIVPYEIASGYGKDYSIKVVFESCSHPTLNKKKEPVKNSFCLILIFFLFNAIEQGSVEKGIVSD